MSSSLRHLTREDAAKALKVSIRTIDRYIRRGMFEVQKMDRNVLIFKPSFERYYQEHVGQGDVTPPPAESAVGEASGAIETIEVSETDTSEAGATMHSHVAEPLRGGPHHHNYELQPVAIYKGLYEELKTKYDEQVKRLEGAHYRVGQLEAQLKNMVPLLEYRKEQKRLATLDRQYNDDIRQAKVRVIETRRLAESERFNKNVYIALVYGLLALQPVFWLFLQG